MRLFKLALIICGAGLASIALPALSQGTGFYVGVGAGYSTTKIDDNVLPIYNVSTVSGLSTDDDDWGWKAFIGYAFTPNFALEFGYANIGEFSASRTALAPVTGTVSSTAEGTGWALHAVGTVPLGNNFSLFGKIGVAYVETEITTTLTGPLGAPPGVNLSPSEHQWRPTFGAGLRYDFSPSFAIRGEWEQYSNVGISGFTGKTDVDLFSLHLLFKF